SYQLHTWENNGWLGPDEVLKDPDLNNQRVYSDEQMERIHFLKDLFDKKRKQGVKRVAPKLVEEKLLEHFGGEITEMQRGEITVLPSSMEEFQSYMLQQSNMIAELKEMVSVLQQRELPRPQEPGITKEQANVLLDRLDEERRTKNEIENEMKILKDKLDVAVDYIQQQEENQEKKGFWKRIFG